MPPPTVSVIIANWNGGERLRECLEALRRQTLPAAEIIVVDNGSTDGSPDGIPDAPDRPVRVIRLPENRGFAYANNLGFRESRGDCIALVNNDVILSPDWIAESVRALRTSPRTAAVATRILQRRRPEYLDSAGFDFHPCGTVTDWRDTPAEYFADRPHRPFGPVAAAALYRRSALNHTGLFRDPFFCYYEDTDLAFRLRWFGFDTVYAHRATALHDGSFTGGRRSDFQIFHLRRNAEYLYWLNMQGILAWAYLPAHLAYETGAWLAGAFSGQALMILKAKRDALRHLRWIRKERAALARRLADDASARTPREMLALMRPARSGLFRRRNLSADTWKRTHGTPTHE